MLIGAGARRRAQPSSEVRTLSSVTTPRVRVAGACARLGRSEVVHRCNSLLAGGSADVEFVIILGGPAAARYFDDGQPEHQEYWLRVWGARGLLWAGPGVDTAILRNALADEHWRVREMACKVVARHRVGGLLELVSDLEADPVKRVRTAASRAAMNIVQAGA